MNKLVEEPTSNNNKSKTDCSLLCRLIQETHLFCVDDVMDNVLLVLAIIYFSSIRSISTSKFVNSKCIFKLKEQHLSCLQRFNKRVNRSNTETLCRRSRLDYNRIHLEWQTSQKKGKRTTVKKCRRYKGCLAMKDFVI